MTHTPKLAESNACLIAAAADLLAAAKQTIADLAWRGRECPICGHDSDESHDTFCGIADLVAAIAKAEPKP